MTEYVYVAFPNHNYEKIHIDVVRKWNIREPEQIDDVVFFWVGDLRCKMSKEDYVRLFGEK